MSTGEAASGDAAARGLILHHYDFSNFAEKARLMLGLKGLAWESVEIPSTQPKPKYTPLTAGYRRTPALQVGAEVYCDTRRIADYLESRAPTPTLFPGDPARARALCDALSPWAEDHLLWPLALYVTGINEERFPDEFHRDRAILHGKRPPTRAQIRRAAERNLTQLRPQLSWVDGLIPEDAPFLTGPAPGLVDFTVYHPFFLLEVIGGRSPVLDEYPRICAWMDRVAAIGHGDRHELDAEHALDRAAALTPPAGEAQVDEAGFAAGDAVVVMPRDDRSAPSEGRLERLGPDIRIRHTHPRVGEIAVHFPRVGYEVRAVDPARADREVDAP